MNSGPGVAVGVAVGVGLAVGVAVPVGVAVGVAVGSGVAVSVGRRGKATASEGVGSVGVAVGKAANALRSGVGRLAPLQADKEKRTEIKRMDALPTTHSLFHQLCEALRG